MKVLPRMINYITLIPPKITNNMYTYFQGYSGSVTLLIMYGIQIALKWNFIRGKWKKLQEINFKYSSSFLQHSAPPMALLSLVPVLLPCQWCVLNWSWNPSFLWSWRVSLPFTVWSSLSWLPANWTRPQHTPCTSEYIDRQSK